MITTGFQEPHLYEYSYNFSPIIQLKQEESNVTIQRELLISLSPSMVMLDCLRSKPLVLIRAKSISLSVWSCETKAEVH